MAVITHSIEFNTEGDGHTLDVTPQTQHAIDSSGLSAGTATVFCPGSTGGLTTIEYEPGVVHDLNAVFEALAPHDRDYKHHLAWGDDNGRSHVKAGLLGPSITVLFVNGRLTLGTWQQIVFIDFDTRSRQRALVVQLIGE